MKCDSSVILITSTNDTYILATENPMSIGPQVPQTTGLSVDNGVEFGNIKAFHKIKLSSIG
jgi:hypothetical protein